MGSIDNITISKGFQVGLKAADYVADTSEPLEKLSKMIFRAADFAMAWTGKVSEPLLELSNRLKNTVVVFEGVNLFGRIKELACPNPKTGEYFFQTSSWAKCADRVFLTVAGVFKMMNAGIKFGLIQLAQLAKMSFGRIPLLRLIPDTLVAISSFFSICDNVNVVKTTGEKLATANEKAEKWSRRPALIEQVRSGNVEEITKLKSYYQGRVVSFENQLDKEMEKVKQERNVDEISKYGAALRKCHARIEMINNQEHIKLADDLAKQDVKFKQHKWSVVKGNETIGVNKAWLGIVGGVSKIFVIAVAAGMTTLGLVTTPYALSLLAIGITVDSIGFTKTMYDFIRKPQVIPTRPITLA